MKIPDETRIPLIIILSLATIIGIGSFFFLTIYENIEKASQIQVDRDIYSEYP